jgi:ATP-binding cassette, subfamily G (WHITE), eye pigment precursor transporter
MPLLIISGFFKNSSNMPDWYGWLQYISPFKYGFIAITENEVKYKASLVSQLNFDLSLWSSVAALIGLGVAFRVLSCYMLWLKKKRLE